jgi:hypothetical protein
MWVRWTSAWRLRNSWGFVVTLAMAGLQGGCTEQPGETGVVQPDVATAEVRKVGDSYEVEIDRPSGFYEGAYDFSLKIGEMEWTRYRPSDAVRSSGLVFTISGSEFAKITDGAPIVLHYGPSARMGGGMKVGTFDKSAVEQ